MLQIIEAACMTISCASRMISYDWGQLLAPHWPSAFFASLQAVPSTNLIQYFLVGQLYFFDQDKRLICNKLKEENLCYV